MAVPSARQRLVVTAALLAFASLSSALVACPLYGQASADQAKVPAFEAEDVVVRPGDVLRISVWPETSLGGDFPVESNGYAYLPILGEVPAGNVSLSTLRAQLREGYSSNMKNPVVTVTPLFRVSVLGAVARPALYNVDPTHTLFDVISLAGGLTTEPERASIRIIRDSQIIEVGGRDMVVGTGSTAVLSPQSGDRIIVTARPARGRFVQTGLAVLNAAVLLATLVVRLNR